MIRKGIGNKTSITKLSDTEGEFIETKVERISSNNEPITEGAPLIFSERKEGVIPDYDVRTDKWDVAVEAADVIAESKKMQRDQRQKTKDGETPSPETHGTEPDQNPAA